MLPTYDSLLFDNQVILPGNAGYKAAAEMNTPAYTAPGAEQAPPTMHSMKPTAMMQRHARMNGYRFPTRSLNQATEMASTDAVM